MTATRGVRSGFDSSSDDGRHPRTRYQRHGSGDDNDDFDSDNRNGSESNGNGTGTENDSEINNSDEGKDSPSQSHQLPQYDPHAKNLDHRRSRRNLKHEAALCGEGNSFMVVSAPKQPQIQGCYVKEQEYNGEAMYVAHQHEEAVNTSHGVIGAAQTDPHDNTHTHWSLVYTNTTTQDDDKRNSIICSSVDMAQNVHPANSLWACDFDGKGSFFLTDRTTLDLSCGCNEEPGLRSEPQPVQLQGNGTKDISGLRHGGVLIFLPLCFLFAVVAKMLSPFCQRHCDRMFAKRSLRPGTPTRTS